MENLVKKLIVIIKPLTKDNTIPKAEKELIQNGFDILIDESLDLKDRVQQSCDYFDIAQYKPYNPFHARVELARAIAFYEQHLGIKEFVRSKSVI